MARETAEESGMNYARCPDGWLLAHNIVRPEAANTRNGWKGFRRFWISPKKKKEMEKRACGSAGAAGGRTSGRTTAGSPRKRSRHGAGPSADGPRAASQGRGKLGSVSV